MCTHNISPGILAWLRRHRKLLLKVIVTRNFNVNLLA